mmetsp:Transcript_107654/g.213930  ORF Transcript_107654/g.213930 Transcript_107654/m.213930 type:complete len:204 (+) Transcript_107654:60-671(+)|eukprot:CAMPEP_0172807902 /NCGR_PEP_ID=MMETSP1075-20121228/7325_1 /TAXON_ID=2916 /ORGANISM="Ceratium fusus, Strain PA161109" /LENGTH=203 /DNA_ID=CAMNT_0013646959 /DNA_START=60 /DNA_END=671 /DNA_ORIENTATION=-
MDVNFDFLLNVALFAVILFIGWYNIWRTPAKTAASQTTPNRTAGSSRPPLAPRRDIGTEASQRRAAAGTTANTSSVETPVSPAVLQILSKRHRGLVKRYSERNGMGFITCNNLRAEFGVDVRFYHDEIEELGGLQVGEGVEFSVELGGRPGCPKNNPWASDISRLPDMEDKDESSLNDGGTLGARQRRVEAEASATGRLGGDE